MSKEIVIITVAAIAAIAVLEAFAIKHGVDGVALAGGVAAIAGITGYQVKKIRG